MSKPRIFFSDRSRALSFARNQLIARLLMALALISSAAAVEKPARTNAIPSRTTMASKGTVGLKFTLLKTQQRLDEPLFAKVTLTNRSSARMLVSDWIFRGSDDVPNEWADNSSVRHGTYLEVRAPDGSVLQPLNDISDALGLPADDGRKSRLDKEIDAGKTAGLTQDEINRRINEEAAALRDKKYPEVALAKGQSVTTAQWCSAKSLRLEGSRLCPGAGFVELDIPFDKPGRYRARIVYDQLVPTLLRDEYARDGAQIKEDKSQIRVATDWIEFEVYK